jgi:hypothetical protein
MQFNLLVIPEGDLLLPLPLPLPLLLPGAPSIAVSSAMGGMQKGLHQVPLPLSSKGQRPVL